MSSHRYFVVRFIENLTRGETKNIGVFYEGDNGILGRFLGEKRNGTIDLRSVRSLVPHTPTYKQWIDYWKRVLSQEKEPEIIMREIQASAKGNFIIEEGDRIFIPREMSDTDGSRLGYLFNLLVAEFPSQFAEDFLQQSLSERCDEIIKRFHLRKDPHFRISPTVQIAVDGSTVHLKPSYQWLNGRDIYYQKVTINQARLEATQKDVTSAAWVLDRLKESTPGVETRALVKISDVEETTPADWRPDEYLDLLATVSDSIINVDNDDEVVKEFSALHS